MLSKEFLLALLIGCLLQLTWTRTVSITLNLNLDLAKHDTSSKLSADMVHNCLKRTEVTMVELASIRMGLTSKSSPVESTGSENENMLTSAEENIAEDKENYVDYDNISPIVINEKFQEPIQCFAHCLYEQLGVIKDGVFIEDEVQRKLFVIMKREHVQLPECMDMASDNRCDAAFKLYLCYTKLKMLESENYKKTFAEDESTIQNDDTLNNIEDDETAADDELGDDVADNEISKF